MTTWLGGRVQVHVGDITKLTVDAIVNAANSALLGGGGVDGAIHRAGGPEILEACRELRATRYPEGLPTGQAVTTTAGRLDARAVIHTVGPVYSRSGDPHYRLQDAYRNSLADAAEAGFVSVAFPAISTGVYGYPKDKAAIEASTAIAEHFAGETSVERVLLVFFHPSDAETFAAHSPLESP